MSAGKIISGNVRPETPASPRTSKAITGQKSPAGAKGSAAQAPFIKQSAIPAGELFKQSAAALKLPVDTLSVTLLALSRFFSLPPSQALIAALRKEVLTSNTSSPQTPAEKAALEAKAFAAAAAWDKGVFLSPEALERYARFLNSPLLAEDPESRTEESPENQKETGGKDAFARGGGGKGKSPDREELPTSDELRAIAEEESKEEGFLDLLNSLPGKNGQYWVVFPLKITVEGTELRIFIRILKGEPFLTGENEHLIVDIAGSKRQYRCFLKKTSGNLRADIRVYPELSPGALKLLSKKAKSFLEEGVALTVRNGEEMPAWVEEWCAECLPSIDEEV